MGDTTVSLDSCPFEAGSFADQEWAARCAQWGESGPDKPAWLVAAHDEDGAQRAKLRERDAARSRDMRNKRK